MFQTPKGMRDFLPEEMRIRNHVIGIIREVLELYGFEPLQTPALESGELLLAKGGEEIRKEIYIFEDKGGREVGLRFDLTVPMCRVVASDPHLTKPFKRYATGMIWRYENPQAGRFREFQQFDADIVGVDSIDADIECVELADFALRKLGFKDYTIKLNNRKVLEMIMQKLGISEKKEDVMIAIDKLEKIGEKGVIDELAGRGVDPAKAEQILSIAGIRGGAGVLDELEKKIGECEGLEELKKLAQGVKHLGNVEIDVGMVRGLDYYTGSIFEIKSSEDIGTITAGGRYDKMIGQFGGQSTPAVGISFGVERIIEVLKRKGLIQIEQTSTKVLVIAVGSEFREAAKNAARELRQSGINTELDLMDRKLSKNLDYANKKGIPFVALMGEKEADAKKITLKEMKSGAQDLLDIKAVVEKLS